MNKAEARDSTALMAASNYGHVDHLLLARLQQVGAERNHGADSRVAASSRRGGAAPALRARCVNTCSRASKVNKTAQNGATALMYASQNGHVEVVRLLLARLPGQPDLD